MISRRRYRVAHVITRLELGGAQQNTLYCTKHHDRTRFSVDLLAGRGGLLDDEALRIPDARVELLPSLRHPISPWWDLVVLFRLRAWFRARRIDLVHTHSSKAGILGRAAAHLAGVPAIVHTVHGWSFNPTQPAVKRGAYAWIERLAARVTDRLVAVSAVNRDEGLRRRIGDAGRYVVLHSGIEIERHRHPEIARDVVRGAMGFAPEHRVVGTLSCLKPQKAPLDFVRVAERLHAVDDRYRFFVAGDGELRPEVERLVRERRLEGVVRLLGWRRDVVDLLHAMDVFLLPSLFEGLPRAVLQAMAAGVPVVATRVDGTPEVVRDGETGLLFAPGRPEEGARCVLRMEAESELRARCVAAARERLGKSFDIGRMVEALDRLYLELLEGGRGERADDGPRDSLAMAE